MDKSRCWKCNEPLVEGGCPLCDVSMVSLIRESINRTKKHADAIGEQLSSFKKKMKSYRDKTPPKKDIKDIGFAINTLCNIVDLLEEGNSHLISDNDLNEVHEKSQQIIKCVETLRRFKRTSDEQTSQ